MTVRTIVGARRTAARAAVRVAWRNFGTHAFWVDPAGPHWQPLQDAAALGWVTWLENDRCALRPDGVAEAAPWQEAAD